MTGETGATDRPIRWRVWALAITVPALLFIATQLDGELRCVSE